MRLLLFSDVHCRAAHCRALVAAAEDVDLVIGAGDLATVRTGLERTVAMLSRIQRPTVLVPGNNESHEELVQACRDWPLAEVLHGSGTELLGRQFYGVGGGIPITPFGSWSYDIDEAEAEQLLAACPNDAVLVTHSPPAGVVDVSSSGHSLGSRAIRRIILERKPALCVCGHIHGSGGQFDRLGETPVVNAGPEGVKWSL